MNFRNLKYRCKFLITLFKDFKLSGSFYYANTYNQTFDPELPVSARYDKLYVQTGYVRNYGFEAMLAYNHRWGDFGWDTSFTYSTNKNEIVELVRNYVHPETGVIYNVDKLELKTNEGRGFGKAKFILKEGGTLGDLYTHADLKRDINGNVLIDDDGTDRQALLEQKAEDSDLLNELSDGKTYRYDFHYLDLVDAYNGNAWVSASYGTTIYLPYPDGVTMDNANDLDVQVIHFPGLHREYGIAGQAEVTDAIEACEPEVITAEFDANGIEFDVDRSGFSPFAVVWQENAQTFTITASAGDGGSISPRGSVAVAEGADKIFTITPNGGYTIANVKVDEKSVGAVDSYTFTDVNANHTISATFARDSSGDGGGHDSDPYLRFDSNGGTRFDPIDEDGRSFSLNVYDDEEYGAHIPTRPGYRFTGWYKDSRLTIRVDEDETLRVTSSVTLFAGWTETSVPGMLNGDDHYAYIQGYSDGSVRPNANITRAQVATIFFRLLDENVRDDNLTTSNAFPDVNEDYWANTAISTMARLGVINGRNSGLFDPDANITRAEFAAICARFDDSGVAGVTTFTDTADHWAEDEISRAAALGWIQGYSDDSFRPDQYISRAQAVTMINRVLCRLPEDTDDLLSGMNTWTDCHESDWFYLAIQEATNSHDFVTKDRVYESWTDLNRAPDWSRYE